MENKLYNKIKNKFTLIHGPCSIESYEQVEKVVQTLKDVSPFFRGGVYKPRTSPDSFQGLKKEGLKIIDDMKLKYNDIIFTSEITSIDQLEEFKNIDILQIGARNMQNYELLKAVGKTNKIILLKRGFGNTADELISSAKYISNEGNQNIILCERGIRTFSEVSRFTLDFSAISYLQEKTNYPIFVDPSHAGGRSNEVLRLMNGAFGYGCDGMIVEVHPDPTSAKSDPEQQISLLEYDKYIRGKDITFK